MNPAAPDRLPCGADVDDLLEQAADGRADQLTAHQAGCPHCQAALAEYDRLLEPVRGLAAEPVPVPDTILSEVLRRIRGSLPEATYGIIFGPRGNTRIAGHLVAVTARISTEQVSGVRVALARDEPTSPDVEAGTSGVSTALRITLAADWGEDLRALAERVRAAVIRAVADTTGLQAVRVDITIDDVLEPADRNSA